MRWRRWGFGHRWSSWGELCEAECMGLARRGASQPADEGHRFLAGGAVCVVEPGLMPLAARATR